MTQCERILDYIDRHGSISQTEAKDELGIMRLASRGCTISNGWVTPLQERWNTAKTALASARYMPGTR